MIKKPKLREMVNCANPECVKMVEVKNRKANKQHIYCSLKCRHEFSPVMQRVCVENDRDLRRAEVKSIIEDLIAGGRNRAEISIMLGITAKTLRLWIKKFNIAGFSC